ncbi:hypothetical protein SNL152K_4917 [Streptomyces sp. NL15-2K]|nr:hypothetical protein SNL152K_4917 [Streptomyces sp. NL15-2K]
MDAVTDQDPDRAPLPQEHGFVAIAQMLHRQGFSHQVPARRAVEGDEEAVSGWVKETWPQLKTPRRRSGPGSASRRGGLLDDAAHDADLGQTRTHSRHPSAGTFPAPVLDRRHDEVPDHVDATTGHALGSSPL